MHPRPAVRFAAAALLAAALAGCSLARPSGPACGPGT
jgi:hypothetical protein